MTPAASVVIPVLNEEGYLPCLLESLRSITAPLDIIVVDGASTDRTCEVVEEFQSLFTGSSSLTLIRSQERGIALQRNIGAQRAKYDTLIFCDADVIFPSALSYETIVSEFIEKGYVVAAPLLKPVEPGSLRKGIYGFLSLIQNFLMFLGKPYFPGACLITSKNSFEKVGGFDTGLVLAEDVDYSLRVARLGTFGVLNAKIQVSDRRYIKYGYGWAFAELPNIFRLVFTGELRPETIYYPFGGYGGQEAHHVNSNTGNKGA